MTAPGDALAITVRLFAGAREAAGAPVIDVRLPGGAIAGDVWEHLPTEVRAVVDPATTRIAVNGTWTDASSAVSAGDELALITPVSGGCP